MRNAEKRENSRNAKARREPIPDTYASLLTGEQCIIGIVAVRSKFPLTVRSMDDASCTTSQQCRR